MLLKKCRKLEKQLNDENEKKDELNDKYEIEIIDESKNFEEERDENNEKAIKSKLSKPPPILNFDLNSLNLVNYKVNNNNLNYNKYNNYYRGYDSTLNYQPRNYSYYCTSHFNSQNNKYKSINDLAKSNDYTYSYSSKSSRNNPYLLKNNLKYNKTHNIQQQPKLGGNCSYLEYLEYKKNKKNNNISPYLSDLDNANIKSYSYTFEEKPHVLRSSSTREYRLNNNNLRNNHIFNENRYYSARRNIKRRNVEPNFSQKEERFTYVINDYEKKYEPIILIQNDKNNDSIDSRLNYKYI